ncbi:hypothetical protein V8B55DRAFT_1434402 [Mucor lusitanicus]
MFNGSEFLNSPYWYEYKVVPGRKGPRPERSKTANINSAKSIFESHGIYSSKKTHSGRHSATIEAESLGVCIDEIKRGGGWKDHLGRLETFYLGKLPWQFARGLAGFLGKPYYLPRKNAVKPPLELQRMVFPWIEDFLGDDVL